MRNERNNNKYIWQTFLSLFLSKRYQKLSSKHIGAFFWRWCTCVTCFNLICTFPSHNKAASVVVYSILENIDWLQYHHKFTNILLSFVRVVLTHTKKCFFTFLLLHFHVLFSIKIIMRTNKYIHFDHGKFSNALKRYHRKNFQPSACSRFLLVGT